jgi:ABC-type uncharacterized transport system permease subunit
MTTSILNLAVSSLYVIAGILLTRRLFLGESQPASKRPVLMLSATAVILHCSIIYIKLAPQTQWSLGLTNALSVVACAVAIVFTVIAWRRPIENLGAVVMPAAAVSVIVAWLWPSSEGLVLPSVQLTAHLIVSILAYAFLSLAVVQALLLSTQEKHLRRRHPARLLKALPPIQTMESLLFILTSIGFGLLTLTLISGAVYTRSLFGVTFTFNHHTVLSIAAWIIFGILLIGHFKFGWRGRHAAHWTIGGFVFLVLAYFGTKYVAEILLG